MPSVSAIFKIWLASRDGVLGRLNLETEWCRLLTDGPLTEIFLVARLLLWYLIGKLKVLFDMLSVQCWPKTTSFRACVSKEGYRRWRNLVIQLMLIRLSLSFWMALRTYAVLFYCSNWTMRPKLVCAYNELISQLEDDLRVFLETAWHCRSLVESRIMLAPYFDLDKMRVLIMALTG